MDLIKSPRELRRFARDSPQRGVTAKSEVGKVADGSENQEKQTKIIDVE